MLGKTSARGGHQRSPVQGRFLFHFANNPQPTAFNFQPAFPSPPPNAGIFRGAKVWRLIPDNVIKGKSKKFRKEENLISTVEQQYKEPKLSAKQKTLTRSVGKNT